MVKNQFISDLLKVVVKTHIENDNLAAIQSLLAANSMTAKDLFARYIDLESIGDCGQMG